MSICFYYFFFPLRTPNITPDITAPTIQEPITLTGSLAAKGIAPSVIKDKPSIKFEIFSYKKLGEILKIEKFIY